MADNWYSLIDFNKVQIHLNPSLPLSLRENLKSISMSHEVTYNKPRVWILSSGTSSVNQNSYKLIGLTSDAFFASALAVNNHLLVSNSDSWLNVLPLFHVGGLSILYRSYKANIPCHNLWNNEYKWNPLNYVDSLKNTEATLTSLVPTQVYDLIAANIRAPSKLRAVIVGGASLSHVLYSNARKLGWPLLPSFGMTEAASQIATASIQSLESNATFLSTPSNQSTIFNYPKLRILDHISAEVDINHILSIKGSCLFEGYYPIIEDKSLPWVSPIDSNGWFKTQDCANIDGQNIFILSRTDDVIKINGEMVNLAQLRNKLEGLCSTHLIQYECTICAIPDTRNGFQLILVGNTNSENLQQLFTLFNSSMLPYEKITNCYGPIAIPKNPLGKILHNHLSRTVFSKLND